MMDGLIYLPSHLRDRLASALDSGLLVGPPSSAAPRSVLGGAEPVEPVAEALAELYRLGVTGQTASVWIRTIRKGGVAGIPS